MVMSRPVLWVSVFFFFQAEDGIRDLTVTGVQTCALPISVGERTIDDVAVASDPADISRAPKDIFVANVEDVFRGRVNADQIAARSMEDAFWFASGTTCIEKIKRMLAVEWRGRTVRIDILQLAMPPDIP